MSPRSLRLRLLLGAVVAITVALGIAWIAMTVLFQRHIERRLAAELAQDAVPLIAGLSTAPGRLPILASEPADARFTTPGSGLYWQVSATGGAVRSRSLWDAALPLPARAFADGWRTREMAGPFRKPVIVSERLVRLKAGDAAILVQVATDADALDDARREFGLELAAFLVMLGVVLSAAAWAQVALGLRPLVRVEGEIARLRRDPGARFTGRYPHEIAPLTAAIDALADAREADLARARRRAADLAHGMKTPLAALAAQSREARAAGAGAAADGLDRAIAALGGAVQAELRRARVAVALAASGRDTPVRPAIDQLVAVIERIEGAGRVRIDVVVETAFTAPVDGAELIDLLGPPIENAVRHAQSRVRIGQRGGGIAIEDDGPGIAENSVREAVLRGWRLDESGGDGLGLAITKEIVEASGGRIALERSALGGLAVLLRWGREQPP